MKIQFFELNFSCDLHKEIFSDYATSVPEMIYCKTQTNRFSSQYIYCVGCANKSST